MGRPAPRPAYSVLGHDGWSKAGLVPIGDWQQALGRAFPALAAAEAGDAGPAGAAAAPAPPDPSGSARQPDGSPA
jgi:hypothetical protein